MKLGYPHPIGVHVCNNLASGTRLEPGARRGRAVRNKALGEFAAFEPTSEVVLLELLVQLSNTDDTYRR